MTLLSAADRSDRAASMGEKGYANADNVGKDAVKPSLPEVRQEL